ncbi:MAG: hypothetical protein IH983_13290 [Planctomycetes bacterium]|nr:hypothetical protein [Planctomycetota bacterium]
MKRRLFTLVLFLLLGAVVNVAVAWGCVYFQATPWDDVEFLKDPNVQSLQDNHIRVYDTLEDEQLRQFGVFDSEYVAKLDESRERSSGWFSFAWRTRCGWPLLSLDGGRWSTLEFNESKGRHKFVATFHKTVIPVNPAVLLGDLEYLPLRPIWPGFAVNTLFYAAILWLLIPVPFVLRRLIRHKRGLCVA